MRRFTTFIILMSFLLLSGDVFAKGITAEMRAEDPRLEAKVTFSSPAVYLGEFLQELSKQTKVKIQIDHFEPASGIPLVVYFPEMSLSDALNAVYSMISFQGSEWHWLRKGEPGRYTYTLVADNKVRTRRSILEARMQKELEEFVRLMSYVSQRSPKDHLKYKTRIAKALGVRNESEIAYMFTVPESAIWKEYRFFSGLLTPEQQTRVLRGERYKFPVSSLPPSIRKDAEDLYFYRLPSTRPPFPEEVGFYSIKQWANRRSFVPFIYLEIGLGTTSSLASGHKNHTSAFTMNKLWVLSGETQTSPEVEKVIQKSEIKEPPFAKEIAVPPNLLQGRKSQPRPSRLTFRTRLLQMAHGASLPLIANIPEEYQTDFDAVEGKTVKEVLEKFERTAVFCMTKWRKNLLLINYPSYFLEDTDTPPYAALKIWRESKDRMMDASEFVEFMSRLTEPQFKTLYNSHLIFQQGIQLRPYCLYAKARPEMLSLQGLRITQAVYNELSTLLPPDQLNRLNANAYLRIRSERDKPLEGWVQTIVEAQTGQDKPVVLSSMAMSKEFLDPTELF